ncbi:hypothetical protein HPB52_019086 [Rhipicephalus sanguineus]|uniref:Uncharacterized protein n=1 Tax=Rhipicephalus sanguineus TaxID=34632 RepID=A0A9D4T2Y4_RHISA|nr:hypothetical protein HPB52_019086 [Rhipicephalus sanguineus]
MRATESWCRLQAVFTRNKVTQTVGAVLLSAGLVALLRPELEVSRALLDDDSGRPPAEVAGFYIVSGCMLLLIATLGCGGSCGERYGWMVVVCTKNFDVNNRRHWSILVQSLAVFVLLVTLTLATTVCCKARARRGYLAVPL